MKVVKAYIFDVVPRQGKRSLMIQVRVYSHGLQTNKYMRFMALPVRWDDLIARIFIEEQFDDIQIQDNMLTEFDGESWI